MAHTPSSGRLTLPTKRLPASVTIPSKPTIPPMEGSVVYLMQEPSVPKATGRVLDTSPLLWWGKVRTLMERGQYSTANPAAAVAQIKSRLSEFDPAKDYIAIAGGDTLTHVIVGAILAQMGHTYIQYLIFSRTRLPDGSRDPSSGSYVPIVVPISIGAASAANL